MFSIEEMKAMETGKAEMQDVANEVCDAMSSGCAWG